MRTRSVRSGPPMRPSPTRAIPQRRHVRLSCVQMKGNRMRDRCYLGSAAILLTTILGNAGYVLAADAYTPFDGEKTAWHDGFDRYDFVMDEQTLAITPFKAPQGEGFGVKDPPQGPAAMHRGRSQAGRRPAIPGPGAAVTGTTSRRPKSNCSSAVSMSPTSRPTPTLKPGKEWDAWYAFLTEKHGLSKKPAFIGMSRGGEYAYTWATRIPTRSPASMPTIPAVTGRFSRSSGTWPATMCPCSTSAAASIPCWAKYSTAIENIYQQFGGRISVMIKEGYRPSSAQPARSQAHRRLHRAERCRGRSHRAPPAFVGDKFTKASYYSIENFVPRFPERKALTSPAAGRCSRTAMTASTPSIWRCRRHHHGHRAERRGPGHALGIPAGFVDRGMPWSIWRCWPRDFTSSPARSHTTPTARMRQDWDTRLQAPDRSRLFQEAGDGRRGRSGRRQPTPGPSRTRTRSPASTPRTRSCAAPCRKRRRSTTWPRWPRPACRCCTSAAASTRGSNDQTRVAEKRYKDLGGKITVIIKEGEGHYPLAPKDPKPVVDFIIVNTH